MKIKLLALFILLWLGSSAQKLPITGLCWGDVFTATNTSCSPDAWSAANSNYFDPTYAVSGNCLDDWRNYGPPACTTPAGLPTYLLIAQWSVFPYYVNNETTAIQCLTNVQCDGAITYGGVLTQSTLANGDIAYANGSSDCTPITFIYGWYIAKTYPAGILVPDVYFYISPTGVITTHNTHCSPTVYYSAELCDNFTRNNCGEGYEGTLVNVCEDYGAYTSTVSQGDADDQAYYDLYTSTSYPGSTSYGQYVANLNGDCTPVECTRPGGLYTTSFYSVVNYTDITSGNYCNFGTTPANEAQSTSITVQSTFADGADIYLGTGTDCTKAGDGYYVAWIAELDGGYWVGYLVSGGKVYVCYT